MKYPKLNLFFLLIGLSWGCESTPVENKKITVAMPPVVKNIDKVEPKVDKEKSSVWYSPFVVDISSPHMAFETISFKDVTKGGISSSRDEIMETLADGLGTSIVDDPVFNASYELRYDEEITKPSNHVSCGQNHLYIDVWEYADHFGYSMWSGCSADDEFAHSSVVVKPSDDPTDLIAPLVSDIHKKLAKAHSTKCFLKTC